MSFTTRAAQWLGLRSAEATTPALPATSGITQKLADRRAERVLYTAPYAAPRVAAVFTAVGILATALEQLSIDTERDGTPVAPSAFITRPDPDRTRSEWIHETVTSLALSGNAYWRVWRDDYGHAIAARVLDPNTVRPYRHERTGKLIYSHDGHDLTRHEIAHLRWLMLPGRDLGLGPIQAAQEELAGHIDVTRAGNRWFTESGTPAGVLATEQQLTPEQGKTVMDAWNAVPAGRTRLATHGTKYTSTALNPADAQFLETRRFTKTEILDIFGIPASLSLGIDKGDSETYANIEQDWLGFTRFKLMRYTTAIESALTDLTPRGQRQRMNLESLLRSDTKTRFEIHKLAIDAGIYSAEHARDIEHISHTAAPNLKAITV